MISHESLNEVLDVISSVEENGRNGNDTDCVAWRDEGVQSIVFTTADPAKYLIEVRDNAPCLVTRVSEKPPRRDDGGPFIRDMQIIRKAGNPDKVLEIGKRVAILGLSLNSDEFDPDSVLETGTVTAIIVL